VADPATLADVKQRVGGEAGKSLQTVTDETQSRQRDEAVAALLAQPLTMDGAVRLTVLNNRAVQAELAELDIAQADLAKASRPDNPTFTLARKRRADETEYERSYGIDILGVLTLPWRHANEARHAEQAKLAVAASISRTALDARKAWVNAVAAAQTARYLNDVAESADASAELSRRMMAAGNLNQLGYQRAQLYAAEALAQRTRGQQTAMEAREALVRLLGLSGAAVSRLALPDRLPELPASPRSLDVLGPQATEKRLDLQMARREVDALADALGLTRTTRFINVLETSYLNNSSSAAGKQHGYTLSLELPLFDFGATNAAKAEALYRQALNRAAQIGIDAESDLHSRYAAYRSNYDLARHYRDTVLPLSKAISSETQLRYNGMLSSVFDLMADDREQVASVNATIEAQRAFWEADANLQMAVTTGN
jgi:outer membrane protein TolC